MEGLDLEAPTEAQKRMTAEAVAAMREKLGDGFRVIGRFPFVVGGDPSMRHLKMYMKRTLFEPYEAFYTQFFKTRPDRVLHVYLFNGRESFMQNARRLFGESPSTKYGYYTPSERRLTMNILLGGGTLVHELVHALMHFDFDEAPTWFDEGMGSLFEQSSTRYNRILGYENWRLPILKKGIAEKRTLPLRELMATDRASFLDREGSLHYAQARYFCMYMQHHGLLETFYRAYRDNFEKDPTGVAFAEKVFEKPLEEVEKEWLAWVDTLRFRGR
jgi:hypothetical protein